MFTIQDPIFGTLERQGSVWIGVVWLERLRQEIDLELEYRNENSPSHPEQLAFVTFQKTFNIAFSGIEKAIFHMLLNSANQFTDWGYEIDIPKIPGEVWNIVQVERVLVDSANYQNVCITLVCEFAWDEEHGLDIDFLPETIGLGSGGTHWTDKAHYLLDGNPI
jgi:hypothetical protein